MSETYKKVFMLAVCRECGDTYICTRNPEPDEPLPCGHKKSTILTTSPLGAYEARDMLEWMDKNGCILPEASEAIMDAGGLFASAHKLKVPERDLTSREIDRVNGG
jgi:hypothetical protein